MTFAHPYALLLLALLPALFLLFLHWERKSMQLLAGLVALRLQPVLAGNASRGGRRLRFVLLLVGLAGVIVALARPQMGFRIEEHKSSGRDVLIAIDTSRSMLANDLSPTRLGRARLAAQDLVAKLRGDRVGLIAFAGTAFLQAPLTADYAEVLATLRETDTTLIPVGGTNLAEAIRTATEAFGKGESESRALVIFTDGEELDADGVKAAQEAKETMRIFTVGCGSPEGTIIALKGEAGQTEYVKGPDGQIVKSRLDEARLREIAEATGGFYTLLKNGPPEMQQLLQFGLDRLGMQEQEALSRREPIERYQWPLAAGILFLIASLLPGERRRVSRPALAALAVLLAALPAEAKNRGLEAYDREDYTGAQRAFEEQIQKRPDSAPLQFDLGASAYKAGDYEKALDAFSKSVTTKDLELRAKSEYNLGNTLFQRGAAQKKPDSKLQDWKNSVQHYEEALKTAPQDGNAQYNRDLVKQLIAQLEEQQQQQQQEKKDQQKQDGEKDQNKKDQQQQQQQDQKDQQQQQQDQQQQQQQGQQSDQQEQQSGKGEQKEGQDQKPQEGKDGQQQSAENKEGGQDPQQQPQQGQGGEQKEDERKLSGEIADASDPKMSEEQRQQAEQREAQEREAQEAKEQAQAEAEGKMTPAQAEALLGSVRSQDQRVRLWNEKGPQQPPANLRDW